MRASVAPARGLWHSCVNVVCGRRVQSQWWCGDLAVVLGCRDVAVVCVCVSVFGVNASARVLCMAAVPL